MGTKIEFNINQNAMIAVTTKKIKREIDEHNIVEYMTN